MKKPPKSKAFGIGPFCLPNHRWLPVAGHTQAEWETLPEFVCYSGQGIIARDGPLTWEQSCRVSSPETSFNLWVSADQAISALANKAHAGDSYAAQELARLATLATVELARIAREKPQLLLRYSRLRHAWPVIRMKREALSADEKGLFGQIQLGADAIIELDPQTAKWVRDDAARMAFLLLIYIERARTGSPHCAFKWDYGKTGTAAKKLPPFSDDSSTDWWNLAKSILLASYPKPEAVAELNRLVTAKSKRRSSGRIRQAILDMLQSRFVSFARNTSYQT